MRVTSRLIVNADDFGLSPSVNRGIIKAHVGGIVTSASLMVRWPAAAEAARLARAHPRLGVGLHVDLGEWIHSDGQWVALYEVAPPDDEYAVRAEIEQQVHRFRELTGHGPTHLDSHQHVHQREPARTVMRETAGRLGVPLRHFDPRVRYCGGFYGQTTEGTPLSDAIGVESLCALLGGVDGTAITELCCHPGADGGDDLQTMYNRERAVELQTLCDPRVRQAIEGRGIRLISFRNVIRRKP